MDIKGKIVIFILTNLTMGHAMDELKIMKKMMMDVTLKMMEMSERLSVRTRACSYSGWPYDDQCQG